MKKRIISGFLAVVMLISLLPINVLATDEVGGDIVVLDEVENVGLVEDNGEDNVTEEMEENGEDSVEEPTLDPVDGQEPEQGATAEEQPELDETPENIENNDFFDDDVNPEQSAGENDCAQDEDNCSGGGGHHL